MNDDPIRRRADIWSQYWRTGAAHSLGQSSKGYTGDIARYWTAVFAAQPRGARVLDIASGNGPLPRLMLGVEGRADLQCDAVDLAQVAPAWLSQADAEDQARVRFHPGCDAAHLPFEPARFDLVVSQWGLEYTDLALAVPELLRVLKPEGAVALVVHHAHGQPVQLAKAELAHLDWLAAADGPLTCARAVIPLLARASTESGRAALRGDPAAGALRERFNAAMDALDARAADSSCPDALNDAADHLGALLAQAGSGEAAGALRGLDQLISDQRDAALRLSELVSHAMDETAVRQLALTLAGGNASETRAPARYRLGELRADGALLGWTVEVTRAP